MTRLTVRLLGSFEVRLDDEPVTGFDSNKVRALLAYLAVEADRAHRRESLATLLWPGYPDASARTNLRNALANLRTAIRDHDPEQPCVLVTRETLQWNRESDGWVDVAAFEETLRGDEPPSPEQLESAVGLYTGDFMAGFTLGDSAAFDEWQLYQTEALKDELARALVRLSTACAGRGDLEAAIDHARRWLALDSLHGPAHCHLMVLYAQANQRAAALRQYETCRHLLQTELGVEPLTQTQEAYQRLLKGEMPSLPEVVAAVAGRAARVVGPCPYRGLAAFGEADAAFFFGREAFVERLEQAVTTQPLVALVVGASGSGKSSVVAAGLLPRLREHGGWQIVSLRPRPEPFQGLATALLPLVEPGLGEVDRLWQSRRLADLLDEGQVPLMDVVQRARERAGSARLLLYVDQFEELYTLCPDADVQRRFINTLLEAVTAAQSAGHATAPMTLLVTLRADFMGRAVAHRPLADALQDAARILGPMTREELRAAIGKPAELQGAAFEAGLIERLLDDVGMEPGNLPLLEFALTLLWERLDSGWMTHAAYEAIGRVEGALARYAQEVYEALSSEEQTLARRAFTQLVQPGEGTEDTRRVATRAEVGERAWGLVQHLADRRLVVTGRDQVTGTETVEVVHEALIRSWGELQAWMAEDRAFRTWQERLRVAVHTWETTGHDEGALLRGVPLAEAEEWLRTRGDDLGETEHGFIEAGVGQREAQRQAEHEAVRRLAEAHEAALRQAAVGLAAEARNQMQGPDQDLAVLLALEAVEHYPYTWQAELALAEIALDWRLVWQFSHGVMVVSAPQVSPDETRFLTASNDGVLRVWNLADGRNLLTVQAYKGGVEGNYQQAHWSPDGDRVLTYARGGGRARVWDAESGRLLVECPGDRGCVAQWSPDGTRILRFWEEQPVTVWDAHNGELIHEFTGTEGVFAWYSPNGRWVATSLGQIWDAETGELVHTLEACRAPIAQGERPRFSWYPDGNHLGTGMAGTAWVWDAETGKEVLVLRTGYSGKADLWWSPDGRRLLITGNTGDNSQAALWDPASGQKLRELPFTEELGPTGPWSPPGDRIAVPDAQGHVTVWDADSGAEVLRIRAQGDRPHVTWLPDGGGFITAGSYGELARIWRIAAPGFSLSCEPDCPPDTWEGPNLAAWSPDGTRIARPFDDGSVRVWEVASRRETARITRGSPRLGIAINWVAWSPDSGRILTGGGDGGVEIWDAASGERVLALAGHGDVALDGHWSIGHVVMGVSWSPDGRRALTCGRDRRAVIWGTTTGEVLLEYTGQEFFWGAWSPDGTRIVLCDQLSSGGPVKIWDAETGEPLLTLLPDDFGYGTSAVAWSPDGTRIVTFSMDGVGRLWNAETATLLGTFRAETWSATAQWSPSGERFLAGGSPGGVRVWDAATLHQVARYPTAPDNMAGSWSPDGAAIAIGYANGDTTVYPAWQSLEELIAYAKAHCVLRELTPEERARYGLAAQKPAGSEPPER